MRTVFADTFYYLALLNDRDQAHANVKNQMSNVKSPSFDIGRLTFDKTGICISPMLQSVVEVVP